MAIEIEKNYVELTVQLLLRLCVVIYRAPDKKGY